MIHDPDGIKLDVLKKRQGSGARFPVPLRRACAFGTLHPGGRVSSRPQCRLVRALLCSLSLRHQNELNLADCEVLLANGCRCVTEGAICLNP